jgi:hypothetical protein
MRRAKMDSLREVADQLCAEIRQRSQGKWWALTGMRRMGCTTASRSDPTRLCIGNAPPYGGCNLGNGWYDRRDR